MDKGAEARKQGGKRRRRRATNKRPLRRREKVDLVIASDVICQTADALSLSLEPHVPAAYGVGVVVAPSPRTDSVNCVRLTNNVCFLCFFFVPTIN